jgi:UDP:flavonoid glycosyltransferase YjiC (YdhE family)
VAQVLMVTWDGGGNVLPLLCVGAALRARGHELRLLGHEAQRARIEGEGFDFIPYGHAEPWSRTAPRGDLDVLRTFVDGGAGRDVEEALARTPADVAVVDCLMLGPLQAAQAAGLPTAVLVHSLYAYFGQAVPHGPITAMGEPHGRAPLALWAAADAVLVQADRELDPAAEPIPPNVHWTGVAQPAAAPAPRRDRSRVLLSLSTVWFDGQQESTQRILDALGGLPVQVVATIDANIAAGQLRVPPNVEARGYVSHGEVMPEVSLLIGHGGHATTMLALAHDLPVLVVPQHPMLDQPMIGGILEAEGAGLLVAQEASVSELRKAIATLLHDEACGRAAAAIGARLRAQDGAAQAADRIEAIMAQRAPALAGAYRQQERPGAGAHVQEAPVAVELIGVGQRRAATRPTPSSVSRF